MTTRCDYATFAEQPEYLALNKSFVQGIIPQIAKAECIVDLACGAGTLTQLLCAELNSTVSLPGFHRQDVPDSLKQLIAVDLSAESLVLARRTFNSMGLTSSGGGNGRVVLIETDGESLPIQSEIADVALLGNAIHLFPRKENVLREIYRILRPGGLLAFNTTFYEGARVAGTDKFYRDWMKRALTTLKRRSERTSNEAKPKSDSGAAFSNPWLTADEYKALLLPGGFQIITLHEQTVSLSRENLEAIAVYSEFADAWMHRYPPEIACTSLREAVGPALVDQGIDCVPRNWLEVLAGKPRTARTGIGTGGASNLAQYPISAVC
jgi:ubiquinone/menaquinone biosynthesis C-methylase UbiE